MHPPIAVRVVEFERLASGLPILGDEDMGPARVGIP